MAKRKTTTLQFRKNDPGHNVLAAVSRWVKAEGGSIVVIGGIEVQRWPDAGEFKFKVAVNCVGRAPVKKEHKDVVKATS